MEENDNAPQEAVGLLPAPGRKTDGHEPLYYIGIGASAGGLEALEAFFTHMPTESGLAFIVIQHLSPDYKSLMVELLSKRTFMIVRRAEEGMRVEPNTVYLIPPKKLLTIFHGKLILRDIEPNRGINLPIDIFFRSLADDQAEKSIGIILSGTGSDGVRGIRSIKEAGGMVMVQKEESAKFDGMPRSAIATGLVDVILAPEEMPEKLLSFVRRPYTSPAEHPQALLSDQDGLTRIFALLREQMKVDFTFYKPSTVLRRIDRRMAVNQAADLREYVRILENRPGEVTILYRELLIGVTSFFRDREVFDLLGESFMFDLLSSAENREIRFWVAACSTGEEAYTLAMIAQECMLRMKRQPVVKIFATDIDRNAILRAANGLYPESIAADLPPGLLGKYFIRKEDQYQIQRNIREMVVFAQHNLVKDPPFTNIDFLSCRNVLIYLQPVLQQKVMEFINFSLKSQGILLLGTSETPGDMTDFFEPLHHKFKIYRSRGRKRPSPDVPQFHTIADIPSRQSPVRFGHSARFSSLREEERLQDRLLQSVAEDFISLAIVVNERMELLHIVGDPEGFLRLPSGNLMNDISRMTVKELVIPLTTGLQKVFHSRSEITYTNIRLSRRDGVLNVQMRIRLLPSRKNQDSLAVVFIQESITPKRESSTSGETQVYDINQQTEQHIYDLEQELQFTKENLQATIEELETSNEELQATNEELLASNEELQSTNEELQSVNEELHTVNTEYQTKILQLTETTNDLDNLMASTRIGTLFLDENLEIRKFTPEIGRVFSILKSDIGRPVSHLTHCVEGTDILAIIRQVVLSGISQEKEVHTLDGEWFLMRVLPYHIGETANSGVVLTFTDIGPMKKTESILEASRSQYRNLFNSMQDGFSIFEILVDNTGRPEDFRLISANPAWEQITGIKVDQAIGKRLQEILRETDSDLIDRYGRVALTGEPDQIEIYRKTFEKYLSIYAFRPKDGQVACVIRDISKSKKLEKDLLANEARLEGLIYTLQRRTDLLNTVQREMHIGGWQWNEEEQEMFWTDEVYRIHDFDPGAIEPGSIEHIELGMKCYEPKDRAILQNAFDRCRRTGESYDLSLPFTSFKGKKLCIRTKAQAIMENGKVVKVIGSIADLSSLEGHLCSV